MARRKVTEPSPPTEPEKTYKKQGVTFNTRPTQQKINQAVTQPATEAERETTTGILISEDQFEQLRDVVNSIEAFYELLRADDTVGVRISQDAVADVLRPIRSEMWRVFDEIQARK